MLARSLTASISRTLHQPLERTLYFRLVHETALKLERCPGSGLNRCVPNVLSCSTLSHKLPTHYNSNHTITFSDAWYYGLRKETLDRERFNQQHGMRLKTWNIHRTLQSSTGTTKSVLKQAGMSGKKILKGPRTKQPSRANLPAPEEVSHFFLASGISCIVYFIFFRKTVLYPLVRLSD